MIRYLHILLAAAGFALLPSVPPPAAIASPPCGVAARANAVYANRAAQKVVVNRAVKVDAFAVVPYAVPVAVPVATVSAVTALYSYDAAGHYAAANFAGHGYQQQYHVPGANPRNYTWDGRPFSNCPPCNQHQYPAPPPATRPSQPSPAQPAPQPAPQPGDEWHEGQPLPGGSAGLSGLPSEGAAVLTQHCAGCHDSAGKKGGLAMFDASFELLPLNRDRIVAAVKGTLPGHARMPKGADPLSAEEIKLVEIWAADSKPKW